MTSNHHALYDLGYTRTTMALNKEKQDREVEQNSETTSQFLSLIHISNVLFDLVLPAGYAGDKVELLEQLEQFIKEQDTAYSCIIKVDVYKRQGVASSPIDCALWQGTCTARLPGYKGCLLYTS